VHGGEDDVLVDSEISRSVVTFSKGAALVGNGVGSFVDSGKVESVVVVGLHATSAEGSQQVGGGLEVSIDRTGVQIGASIVEAVEDSVLVRGSDALDGEDTRLVVGVIGLQQGIVWLDDPNLIVGEDVSKVKEQGVLAQVVGDHLGEGNEEVVAAQPVGIGSHSTFMEVVFVVRLEVTVSEDAVGHHTFIGRVIGKRAGSFQVRERETRLTPVRIVDVIAGSIGTSPCTTGALRSGMTGNGNTDNTSEDEEQLAVGHYLCFRSSTSEEYGIYIILIVQRTGFRIC